jgi:hypothetical protein
VKKPKFRIKNSHVLIALVLIMLISTFSTLVFNGQKNEEIPAEEEAALVGKWNGMNLYEKKTSINTSIFYLDVTPGYQMALRGDPRETDRIKVEDPFKIYSLMYNSERVFLVFDQNDTQNVSIAYTELARFLGGRTFDVVFGITSEYTNEVNATLPVINPFNVTENESAVYVKLGSETSVKLENRTVIVSGTNTTEVNTAGVKLELIMMRIIQ